MSDTPRTGVFNATESEKRDAFEWLRARALAGERRAGIMFEELAAAQAEAEYWKALYAQAAARLVQATR